METKEIVMEKLKFLIDEYNFAFFYERQQGDHYYFRNKYGVFRYYEWPEFEEKEFSIIHDSELTVIDIVIENPVLFSAIEKKKRGLKDCFMMKDMIFGNLLRQSSRRTLKLTELCLD